MSMTLQEFIEHICDRKLSWHERELLKHYEKHRSIPTITVDNVKAPVLHRDFFYSYSSIMEARPQHGSDSTTRIKEADENNQTIPLSSEGRAKD